MSESPLIFAKALDGKGGATDYPDLAVVGQAMLSHSPFWLHFDANHPEAEREIHALFPSIDPYSLEAILDQDARPRSLSLDNGMLVIFRGINHNEGQQPEDMIAVRLWITDNYLVSLRYRKSKALMEVAESLGKNRGPKTIGEIFSSISFGLFTYIENGIDTLDEKISKLESQVLDEPSKQLRYDIAKVRKSAIMVRRYIAPQREAMSRLLLEEISWLSKKDLRRVQEAQDTLVRGIEELDSIRERSQIVKDELVNALSDRLNRNLYVLSVITAVFLPLGFLTGLFGINIGGMPGVEDNSAFFIFSLCLAVIVFIQIILFRFFKWF